MKIRTYRDFESFLAEKHGEQYDGLADEMPDDYEEWLANLDPQEFIDFANEYARALRESKVAND